MGEPKTFNHAYDFAFEVVSNKEDASDVTATMLRDACIKRIKAICDEEILEACNCFDTYVITSGADRMLASCDWSAWKRRPFFLLPDLLYRHATRDF